MSNRTSEYYDIDDVVGSVGPGKYSVKASLAGYGEGGGIEVDPEAARHESTAGAGGHVAISANNDERAMVTITCMAGTRLARDLDQLAREQFQDKRPEGVPMRMKDPHSGDKVNSFSAWFTEPPTMSKEDTQSEREYELLLPHGRSKMEFAPKVQ